jgi:hypothetical protein
MTDAPNLTTYRHSLPNAGVHGPCPSCKDREATIAVLLGALKLAQHKAEQIRDGQCNPNARARAIIQVARAVLEDKQ